MTEIVIIKIINNSQAQLFYYLIFLRNDVFNIRQLMSQIIVTVFTEYLSDLFIFFINIYILFILLF